MPVQQRHVRITSPCPVKLDPNRGKDGAKSWYCGHCEKNVHVLSNMSEKEARTLLKDKVGQDLCVSYAVRKDGTVRFKEPAADPTVVPLTSLRRRPKRRPAAVAVAAAAGLTAALAACTPHERPDQPQPEVTVQDHVAGGVQDVTIPDAEPTYDHDGEVMLDGRVMFEGELEGGWVSPEPEPEPQPGLKEISSLGGMRGRPVPDPEPAPVPGGLVVEPMPEAEPCDGDKGKPGTGNNLHVEKPDNPDTDVDIRGGI